VPSPVGGVAGQVRVGGVELRLPHRGAGLGPIKVAGGPNHSGCRRAAGPGLRGGSPRASWGTHMEYTVSGGRGALRGGRGDPPCSRRDAGVGELRITASPSCPDPAGGNMPLCASASSISVGPGQVRRVSGSSRSSAPRSSGGAARGAGDDVGGRHSFDFRTSTRPSGLTLISNRRRARSALSARQ
jgi:hypothetical protein